MVMRITHTHPIKNLIILGYPVVLSDGFRPDVGIVAALS